jgi:hypothetical protein
VRQFVATSDSDYVRSRAPRRRASLLVALVIAVGIGGCGGTASASPPSSPTIGPRIASTATITIDAPTMNEKLTGPNVHVVIGLTGGVIVTTTSTNLKPGEGHIHLYLDNNVVSMNYTLEQDLAVPAGTHVLRAEYVASDHAPFSPRVVTGDVLFTVR